MDAAILLRIGLLIPFSKIKKRNEQINMQATRVQIEKTVTVGKES